MRIKPKDLIPMDIFTEEFEFRIDLAYSKDDNLLFGEAIYRAEARLWLHKTLARVVLLAASICAREHNLRMVLYDGLRTTSAQKLMLCTTRVKQNPHWLEEPRLLSPPGAGAHPRGMAIDISLETIDGTLLDMGTDFDYLAADPSLTGNRAHRERPNLPENVTQNRKFLDDCMTQAAQKLDAPLLLLPQEWWDFRLTPNIYEQYEALSDQELPPQMQLTNIEQAIDMPKDFTPEHFKTIRVDMVKIIKKHAK